MHDLSPHSHYCVVCDYDYIVIIVIGCGRTSLHERCKKNT